MSFNITHLINLDDLEPGDTQRVNHTDCPAGEDTRRRLYVERSLANPRQTVYYCHNCQQGGRVYDDSYKKYRDQRHTQGAVPTPTIVEEVASPSGMVYKVDDWPAHARAWQYKNNLSRHMIDNGGIAYDPQDDRIYLPKYDFFKYDEDGGAILIGYQKRLITGRGPKYTTVQLSDSDINTTQIKCGHRFATVGWVVVEDYVSALHIADCLSTKYPGNTWGVAVNYGTQINTRMLYGLRDAHYIRVWLDNDNTHVINQAKHIADTVKLYGPTDVRVIEDYKDPKHYTPDEIDKVVFDGLD